MLCMYVDVLLKGLLVLVDSWRFFWLLSIIFPGVCVCVHVCVCMCVCMCMCVLG